MILITIFTVSTWRNILISILIEHLYCCHCWQSTIGEIHYINLQHLFLELHKVKSVTKWCFSHLLEMTCLCNEWGAMWIIVVYAFLRWRKECGRSPYTEWYIYKVPGRHVTQTTIGFLLRNFNEISIEIQKFPFKKISKRSLQNGSHFVSAPMC